MLANLMHNHIIIVENTRVHLHMVNMNLIGATYIRASKLSSHAS